MLPALLNNSNNDSANRYFSETAEQPKYQADTNGVIPELRGFRSKESDSLGNTTSNYHKPSIPLGRNSVPSSAEVRGVIKKLEILARKAKVNTFNIHRLCNSLNIKTTLLAMRLIALTGCRPTHHIGPTIDCINHIFQGEGLSVMPFDPFIEGKGRTQ